MEEISTVEAQPVNKQKVKLFLRVMWILAAITAFEFAIAFTVPHDFKWLRIVVFVVLTIFKAYYIVAEFMHLGHEKRSLKMSVVLPMLFVIFLIFILLFQANAIYDLLI
jgi:cytochrome c oxidase subunit IV